MTADFEQLCRKTKIAAFALLDDWTEEFDPEVDVVDEVLKKALGATLPRREGIDGEWVMQMMWQVPDLLETTTYTETMDVNATVLQAVQVRIGDTIRNDIAERAGELGLTSGGHRI